MRQVIRTGVWLPIQYAAFGVSVCYICRTWDEARSCFEEARKMAGDLLEDAKLEPVPRILLPNGGEIRFVSMRSSIRGTSADYLFAAPRVSDERIADFIPTTV